MRYFSCFSGIEAASVAWEPLGWTPVGFSEIDPFASAVLAHRFPNVRNYGDITKHHEWDIGRGSVDVLVGGSPCQAFSVAGLRKGLDDPRGQLTLVYLQLAARLEPEWIVWENVPGVLSADGGRAFGAFLGGLAELGYGFAWRVLDARFFGVPQRRRRVFLVARRAGDWQRPAEVLLEPAGLCWNPPSRDDARQGTSSDAAGGTGVGRWWDGSDCSATLTKQNANGSQRMPDKGNFGAVVIDRAAFNQGTNAAYDPRIEQSESMSALVARGPHAVAHAFYSTGGTHGLENKPDVCPPLKVGSTIGIPSPPSVMYTLDMQGCKGNANVGDGSENIVVQPTIIRESGQGFWMQDEVCGTLRAEGENRPSRPSHVVHYATDCHAVAFYSKNGSHGTIQESNIAPSLKTASPSAVAIPIDGRNAMRDPEKHDEVNRQGVGVGIPGDPAHTVTTACVHAVAFSCKEDASDASDIAPTLRAMSHDQSHANGGGQLAIAFKPGASADSRSIGASLDCAPTLESGGGGNNKPAVAVGVDVYNQQMTGDTAATVTSATGIANASGPKAIAPSMVVRRLLPVECERLQGFPDGWTDVPYRGKPAPDGPRYKALGNSMAVPCMAWIGRRIQFAKESEQ